MSMLMKTSLGKCFGNLFLTTFQKSQPKAGRGNVSLGREVGDALNSKHCPAVPHLFCVVLLSGSLVVLKVVRKLNRDGGAKEAVHVNVTRRRRRRRRKNGG